MHRHRDSLQLQSSMEMAFEAALVTHWPAVAAAGVVLRPSPGHRYLRQEGRLARHGRIIDVQRPVMLVLRELLVAPLPVMRVYFRYRFEPRGERTLVLLETRQSLFAPARLAPWVWQSRVSEENHHRLLRVRAVAEAYADRAAMPVAGGAGAASDHGAAGVQERTVPRLLRQD